MGSGIRETIVRQAEETVTLAGETVRIIHEGSAMEVASSYGVHLGEVFREALEQGIIPYRYIRNHGVISVEDQLKLAESCAGIVGAGGLGGNVIMLLARLGIGRLIVVDADRFDETNLNRQALCTKTNLGKPKATEAAAAVSQINPGVEVTPYVDRLTGQNAPQILREADVIVDALDNVSDRFVLGMTAKRLGIPMVHAGIAGFEGQLMSVFPEDPGLELIFGDPERWKTPRKTPEAVLGVPAVTASLLATLQVMEVLKIILRKGKPVRNKILRPDLETGEFHEIVFT